MKLPRNIVLFVCALVVSTLLSAQAAFATRPCVEADMTAAAAMVQQGEHDCCDTVAITASLCLAKCTDSDKVSGHPDIPALRAPTEVVLTVEYPPVAVPLPHPWLLASSGLDPPKTIRFCTLLI